MPFEIQSGRLGLDGRTLLIGSSTDGFLLLDTEKERVIRGPLSTGGVVSDLVMTRDGKKVFLAMRGHGLKRWSAGSGQFEVLTSQQAPWFVGLDEAGNRLFVTYQGGGPKGRPGHDSVEIFDVATERSMGFLPDLPLVGGEIGFASNGTRMFAGGSDACRNKIYDGVGCPATPANLMHVFRMPDLALLKSVALPLDAGDMGPFLGNSNALLLKGPGQGAPSANDHGLSVFDLASYGFHETLRPAEDMSAVAVASHRHKAYATTYSRSLFAFDFEPDGCGSEPGRTGLLLTGDGVASGLIGGGHLNPGGWVFDAGKIGQAFRFHGQSGATFSSWVRTFGPMDSGLSFYVKPARTGAQQVLLELHHPSAPEGFWSLSLTEESNVELRFGTKGHAPAVLRSSKPVTNGQWSFLSAGRDASGLTLYVDGKKEGQAATAALGEFTSGAPFTAGGEPGGYFDGWIDEIAFYSSGFTDDEARRIYVSRQQGPCKP
ncbi:MAG: LamG domain-containing protein [Bryobacterales bacterium]|nr:LamG domain-containing protein [Bryobacterales bacterium]